MNIATEVQAIIPVGFCSDRRPHRVPLEMRAPDGMTLLCRALAEISGAGITKVGVVASARARAAGWVEPALQSSLAELAAIGLPVPQHETLFLDNCDTMDAAIASAMSCATAPWLAVVCPLLMPADLTGFAQMLHSASASNAPVLAVADADWETALQLCTLRMEAGRVRGVDRDCRADEVQTVFAGRAILPALQVSDLRQCDPWASENADLLGHILRTIGPVGAGKLRGPIRDCRFEASPAAVRPVPRPAVRLTVLKRTRHTATALRA